MHVLLVFAVLELLSLRVIVLCPGAMITSMYQLTHMD